MFQMKLWNYHGVDVGELLLPVSTKSNPYLHEPYPWSTRAEGGGRGSAPLDAHNLPTKIPTKIC